MQYTPSHPYQTGVNLGGWLSQYSPQLTEAERLAHFKTFIQRADIEQIASWGMDHVRLPVDYSTLEDDASPGVYKENGLAFVDQCIEWCRAAGLAVILDLHKAPGFAFDDLQSASLFQEPALQERLLNLWDALARRYQGQASYLAFEPLNEIVLPDSGPWNALMPKIVQRIRTSNPSRIIVVGGNRYNSASELINLKLLDDPNLLYTFHCYAPHIFTHQKAPWVPAIFTYNQVLEYPGECTNLAEFLDSPQAAQFTNEELDFLLRTYLGQPLDKASIRAALQPALDFRQHSGHAVYCGEFGVIDQAPVASNLRWHQDFTDLMLEADIGHAVWSYKQMDFGLVDADSKVVHPELVKIVSRRAV
ncbi:MAG TPA: cellulase family glycosylhydrolase [Anaerolineales bacterium]|nr:cellulase family glycosylhydrolase [Anaerolineales bacterium]